MGALTSRELLVAATRLLHGWKFPAARAAMARRLTWQLRDARSAEDSRVVEDSIGRHAGPRFHGAGA